MSNKAHNLPENPVGQSHSRSARSITMPEMSRFYGIIVIFHDEQNSAPETIYESAMVAECSEPYKSEAK